MAQSLVVNDADEYVRLHGFTTQTTVERLAAVVLVARGQQLLPHVVDDLVLFVELKRCCVLKYPVK